MAEYRQKQEEADWEFRRGLEELVRGHIDGCMSAALASCSSAARGGDEDDDGAAADGSDQLARRRRRSDLEGDDLAESSAAARRHSRILSRWVARQAEEMITTIERRNRESELMALAGLHTVSMLDSSFLREPRRSSSAAQQQQQQSVAVERPVAAARASSLLQRWRELEDAASARERRNAAASAASNRTRPESRAEERQAGSSEDASESDNEFAQWARGQLNTTERRDVEEEDNDRRLSREQSPDAGDIERERVRQIVRGWMTESAMTDADSRISPRTESPRAEWLGETERERVRLVREWVQMASQHRDARSGRREEGERERERDGSVTDHEEGPPEHARRDLLRLRGRQARLDLIMRIVRERERELQGLLEHRAVSDFPHRNRIQSLLRGRFLRNGRPPEEERVPSAAARELGQLRQRHTVSGLRLENIVRGQASSQVQANIQVQGNNNSSNLVSRDITGSRSESSRSVAVVEQANDNHEQPHVRGENIEIPQTTETHTPAESESNIPNDDLGWQESNLPGENWEADDGRRDWQQAPDVEFSEWHDGAQEGSDGNWQENMDQEWSREEPEDEDGEDSQILEMHEEWHENASHETVETWPEGLSDPPRDQRSIPSRRFNRFIPPDDENVYSMELRELLSRRSVSTLLRSGFRESLDQLIQSYVQRQGRAPFDWDLERTLPTPAPPEDDQGQQRDDMNQDQQDSIARAPLVMPSSPVPPPQPLWPSDLHHTSWTRQSMHRTEIEWDIINDLRADMARLQQGMSHMQRMLEACMDMQLELQRSVRQEVSAALNRSVGGQDVSEQPSEDGSKWSHVRKGTCCVCCDNHIDSLLYRCGHMCTCSKCANELVRVGGKCPLCRAPIVEVIRAYCIL